MRILLWQHVLDKMIQLKYFYRFAYHRSRLYLKAEMLSEIYVGGAPTKYWILIAIFIKQFS